MRYNGQTRLDFTMRDTTGTDPDADRKNWFSCVSVTGLKWQRGKCHHAHFLGRTRSDKYTIHFMRHADNHYYLLYAINGSRPRHAWNSCPTFSFFAGHKVSVSLSLQEAIWLDHVLRELVAVSGISVAVHSISSVSKDPWKKSVWLQSRKARGMWHMKSYYVHSIFVTLRWLEHKNQNLSIATWC